MSLTFTIIHISGLIAAIVIILIAQYYAIRAHENKEKQWRQEEHDDRLAFIHEQEKRLTEEMKEVRRYWSDVLKVYGPVATDLKRILEKLERLESVAHDHPEGIPKSRISER